MMGVISVFVGILVVLPGLLTYLNQPKKAANRLFLAICFSLALWVITNYVIDTLPVDIALLFTRLTFFTISWGLIFFWDFTHYFPVKAVNNNVRAVAYSIAALVSCLTLSPWFIPSITYINDVATVVTGSLYIVFIAYFICFILLSINRVYNSYRYSQGIEKEQARYLLLAIGLMTVVGSITNLLLPFVVGNNQYAVIGTYSTLFFTALVSYAMLRHKLFDIRETAARAAAYMISLLVIALLYGGVMYVIGERVFLESEVSRTVERFIFIMFAIITAALFAPIKRFFDRITNLVFYRDAFDPQQFLNELNKLLATTSDLESLLMPSAKIIQNHLKVEYVLFGLREHEKVPRRIVGTVKKNFSEEDISQLRQLTTGIQEKVIVAERIRDKKQDIVSGPVILKILDKYNVAILARLADKRNNSEEGEGYLAIGPKKSGNLFSHQDIEMIEIITNELFLAIQNALRFEEIEQFNETLQEKIYTATKELKKSNDKLKALDEAKDEFISMASHQLRTPLTSVKGYLSMLAEGDAGPLNETQKKFVDQSFISAQRMVYLISDLLNVSRLKTGKFVIERVPTYLPTVIEDEISQLYETATSKGITITYQKPEQFPTLMLDETKIRQVVMNFCDNAIYYSPGGGKVTINLTNSKNQVELTVSDTGMGVPKSVQHHLFTKFYRADNARKVRPDGTGLGLFMAKKVIVAQGGSIIFKSVEGKGSTFGFSFPLKNHDILPLQSQ